MLTRSVCLYHRQFGNIYTMRKFYLDTYNCISDIYKIIFLYIYKIYIYFLLFFRFGGGPACTHLYECPICEEKYESLQKRRHYEMELFQRLNHTTDNHTAIYALAMAWLRQWQSFVRGKETQPPGPIDNNSIVVNKNGQNSLKVGEFFFHISII